MMRVPCCLRLCTAFLLCLCCTAKVTAVAFHGGSSRANGNAYLLLASNNSNRTATVTKRNSSNNKKKQKEVTCVDGVCHIRGGSDYNDDEYDEYEEEEEEELPKRRPSSSQSSLRGHRRSMPPPSNRRVPPSHARRPQEMRRPPPPSRHRRHQRGYSRQRQPSLLNSAAGLAKRTVGLTTAAAVGTVKGSGKAAFYLVSPKHVTRREVWGVWRFDQQVGSNSDTPISCAANIEFTPRGEVVVKYKDQTFETTYLFRERSWPQSCTIEFEARAFQGPHDDDEPVLMRYKGYFRRKMADSKVIKIVGHIYEVPRKGLWRKGRTGQKVGTFVARRRLAKREAAREDFDEEEEEEEYDDDYDFEQLEDEESDDGGEYDEYDFDEE